MKNWIFFRKKIPKSTYHIFGGLLILYVIEPNGAHIWKLFQQILTRRFFSKNRQSAKMAILALFGPFLAGISNLKVQGVGLKIPNSDTR